MADRLKGKRTVITQADDFMGLATQKVFGEEGANIIPDTSDLTDPLAADKLIERAGTVDILIVNLAGPTFSGTLTHELADDQWERAFDIMVHPLHRLTRAVLPQMRERGSGKVVVYGSASALRGMKTLAAYSAARAAQVGYVQAVGVEVAPLNIQINLIAQNYVESEEYYPATLTAKESFQRSLKRQVPAGRLGTPREDALFAVFLASGESDFIVGQAIPFSGGWAQR